MTGFRLIGRMFALWATASPDGSRVLMMTSEPDAEHLFVQLVNSDGSRPQLLTPGQGLNAFGPVPVWHGNDRITLFSLNGTDVPSDTNSVKSDDPVEMVDWKINPDGKLVLDRCLSKGWPAELKPRTISAKQAQPTTAP
jgi:hypothetical protein